MSEGLSHNINAFIADEIYCLADIVAMIEAGMVSLNKMYFYLEKSQYIIFGSLMNLIDLYSGLNQFQRINN